MRNNNLSSIELFNQVRATIGGKQGEQYACSVCRGGARCAPCHASGIIGSRFEPFVASPPRLLNHAQGRAAEGVPPKPADHRTPSAFIDGEAVYA